MIPAHTTTLMCQSVDKSSIANKLKEFREMFYHNNKREGMNIKGLDDINLCYLGESKYWTDVDQSKYSIMLIFGAQAKEDFKQEIFNQAINFIKQNDLDKVNVEIMAKYN